MSQHHASESEIWLVFYKRHTGRPSIPYDEAVEEALCYGWIDSIIRRLDEDRYVRKFTPRRPGSRWSPANRKRYKELESRGMLRGPGLERRPLANSPTGPVARTAETIPPYIERALKANRRARTFFEQLAPSYRQAYIGWIDAAKRETTKKKRLQEAVRLLAAGKKLELK